MLDEIISLRCELFETWSSRGRLKSSIIDLNEIITLNKHKIHSINTQLRAEKRATALLKERLNLSRYPENILSRKARALEQDNERLVQLNNQVEQRCKDLKQRCLILDQHLADKVESEKNSSCLSIKTPQQRSVMKGNKIVYQDKRVVANQRKNTRFIDDNVGNDRTFDTATSLNDAMSNKECKQGTLCMKNDFLSDASPVHQINKANADTLNPSDSHSYQRRSEKNDNLPGPPKSPQNVKNLCVRPDSALLNTTDEEDLTAKRPPAPITPTKRAELHTDENQKFGSTEENEGDVKMDNLLILSELTSSPSTSTLLPIDDVTTSMNIAEVSQDHSMAIETHQFVSTGDLTSPSCFDQDTVMNYDHRPLDVQGEDDIKMFEPLILNEAELEGIYDMFPLEDASMCGVNYSIGSGMEQNTDHVAIVPGEPDLMPGFQVSAPLELQSVAMPDDPVTHQMLDSNIDQILDTGMIPPCIPVTVDPASVSFASRNDLVPNTDQQETSSQKTYDLFEIKASEIAIHVEEYEKHKSEDHSHSIEDTASNKDETDSLDYLFEGPEDIRDLFPGFDTTPDVILPSGPQAAGNCVTPPLIENNPHDKNKADVAPTSNDTEASIISRKYRRSKRKPQSCLRPNVPGFYMSRKKINTTDDIVAGEAFHRNPKGENISCNRKCDDNVGDGKENLSDQEKLLNRSDFKENTLDCDNTIGLIKREEEIASQLDNHKRQRPVDEVDENTRVKKPDIDAERQRNASSEAEPLYLVNCNTLPQLVQ